MSLIKIHAMNNYLDLLTHDIMEYIMNIATDNLENNIKKIVNKLYDLSHLEVIKIDDTMNTIKYKNYTCTLNKNIFNRITSAKTIFYIYIYCYDLNDNYRISFKKTDVLINPTYYDIIKNSVELLITTDNYFIRTYTSIDVLIDSIISNAKYYIDNDIKYYYIDISKIWNAIHNNLL